MGDQVIHSVVGVYGGFTGAAAGLERLARHDLPLESLSLVAQDLADGALHAFGSSGREQLPRLWVRGVFEVLVGAAFLWLPNFGLLLAAGAYAQLLPELGERELLERPLAGLERWGVDAGAVEHYQAALRAGCCLLVVHGARSEAGRALALLEAGGAQALRRHSPSP